ncbi:MAG: Rrf2 family transcriptional regulator [Candidatus Aadella gelida]|nr:Rrf2 family transcriptional regulator [Candidatus Aadella gelida]
MKLLTKNTDYAVRALLTLASLKKDEYLSARQISQRQKVPYQYLRRILQELIKKNLVISREGGGGGFRLKKRPNSIEISGIINIFQGRIQLSDCMFRKKLCHNRSNCVLRNQIQRIESIVASEFSKITIGSLLKDLTKQKGG